MEPEVKEFLKRIALCVFLTFFWLLINCTAGIMFNLAFIENKISAGNILFYLWLLLSFILLLFLYKKLWQKPIE
ncbi:MAG: hypothetical protein ACR2FN_00685 [Chitinophagaceae bacterium]